VNTELVVPKGRAVFLSISLSVMLVVPLFSMIASSITEVEQSIPQSYDVPLGPETVMVLKSTAYNSLESQTDSTPFITATGETTRSGIVALSRDLLETIPYGSTVEIVDIRARPEAPNGCGATMQTVHRIEPFPGLSPGQFKVSDTMHPRKVEQLDMWLEHLEDAERWGACEVVVRVVTPTQTPIFLAQGN
jgi:3D (Asp-Asp-Asp) domain-containing protein